MAQIYLEEPRRVTKHKDALEKALLIKLSIKDKILNVESEPENEFLALQIIDALNLGFNISDALLLKDDTVIFKKIGIKEVRKRKDAKSMERARARVIGSEGSALDTIESLTGAIISLHNNEVGIIGSNESVDRAFHALTRLISGSKHANVYAWLERERAEEKGRF